MQLEFDGRLFDFMRDAWAVQSGTPMSAEEFDRLRAEVNRRRAAEQVERVIELCRERPRLAEIWVCDAGMLLVAEPDSDAARGWVTYATTRYSEYYGGLREGELKAYCVTRSELAALRESGQIVPDFGRGLKVNAATLQPIWSANEPRETRTGEGPDWLKRFFEDGVVIRPAHQEE